MNVHFAALDKLHLLWAVPAAGLLLWLSGRAARAALARFTALEARLAQLDRRRRLARQLLFLLALLAVTVALLRPGWNPQPMVVRQEGRDVVFAVDVSRSMLADDLAPNRLERAKLAILDALPALQGDRVAVVAFAAEAVVVCPLTRDYGFIRWAVEGLSTASVQAQGTLIGDAIRRIAADVFDPREKRFKDLILISDGEDQGSYPEVAASVAGEQGVRILAIGLGDELKGSRIPVEGEGGQRTYLLANGGEVWTHLEAMTLRKMALATPGGRYLPAATGTFDLGALYKGLVEGEKGRDYGPVEITRYQEKFQLFLLVALLLLAAESLLSERPRRAVRSASLPQAALALLLPATLLLAGGQAGAAGAAERVGEGNALYARGELAEAAADYEKARRASAAEAVALYDLGVALYQQDNPAAALAAFQSIPDAPAGLAAHLHYNQGNSLARLGRLAQEEQPQQALALYLRSLGAYRRALELDGEYRAAAVNMEVVRRWVEELSSRLGQAPAATAQLAPGKPGPGTGNLPQEPPRFPPPQEPAVEQPPPWELPEESAEAILREESARRQAEQSREGRLANDYPAW